MTLRLEPWQEGDLPLLQAANTVDMTRHLGGPESAERLAVRHARYLRGWETGECRMYRITDGTGVVGSIGWWSTEWREAEVHETGWFILPGAQGRGLAAAAVPLIVDDLQEHGWLPLLVAFPNVDNRASNRVCERAGFTLAGVDDFPYRGVTLHCNVWTLRLPEHEG
ncbi:GNAT family N-acetyltransferase [Leifsonia sp. F6_8S_P_1B]|uniref:GNAT family N-acetyltransferase n=1 Tax=Leifsonia williamsii TaxID=3035919 RepID=A0ABT8K9M0_9MICO|nr:GNAT family N-acetyltransferase [Leifsonia williamsii]MDN4613187.1 GNAT family N-acetyltransferase [Leifsonia williamsii]